MDNQIINCRCGRERRNKESNWSGLSFTLKTAHHHVVTTHHVSENVIKICS